jgi:DNA polymerase III delta prime subunit
MTYINEIIYIQKLINSTFDSFYNNEPQNEFNSGLYYAFEGINKKELEKLHNTSTLKYNLSSNLNPNELFILLAVVVPFYYPDAYIGAKFLFKQEEESFISIGGKIMGTNNCFYPTGETIIFLLAGHNISKRLKLEVLFEPENNLFLSRLINILKNETGSPRLTGQMFPSDELLTILKEKVFRPEYNINFPASRLQTLMEWNDLALPFETHEEMEELKRWMNYGDQLMGHHDLAKRLKPGYRTLFYGPPGTGKTLTASLIGKTFGVDVYRIDLSLVVSKWVGETEKNLKSIFDTATNKNWILFFDEADALFGKRTQSNSSNDRYANQEVSYLLQRIEDFAGLVILATNLKSNIDEAFYRRFQSVILFPMPNSEIRYILWKKAFPEDFPLEPNVKLRSIAEKYELAGGAINNVVRYCTLKALERKEQQILIEDIEHAIARELKKEGKIVY